MENVSTWLKKQGLSVYAARFEEHGYDDMELLLEMDDTELARRPTRCGGVLSATLTERALRRDLVAKHASGRSLLCATIFQGT